MRSSIILFFCLIFCIPAFSQESGIIRCDEDMNQVPAWTEPGSAYVVEYLSCGQTVSITGLDRSYFRIQLGRRIAYVYSNYVLLEIPEPRIAEPEAQKKELQQPEAPSAPPGEKPIQPHRNYIEMPRRHEGGLYFEVSHIYYDEPDFMRNKDFIWGVSGDYTYRPNNFMFKVDGRFSFGNVDYWSSGTGIAEDLRDYNFETRFSFGFDLKTASKNTSFTPFFGLGYRYLFNGLSAAGPGGYDRKSNYLYSPVGMETIFRLGGGWSLGLVGEYDLFWHGWHHSEFGDAGLGLVPLKFDQNDGWGSRGSVKIIRNFGNIDFAIEPYFRYWDIDDSDIDLFVDYDLYWGWIVLAMHEPPNTTTEWGGKVGIRF